MTIYLFGWLKSNSDFNIATFVDNNDIYRQGEL